MSKSGYWRRIPPSYLAQLVSLGGAAALTFGTAALLTAEQRGQLAVFMLLSSIGSYLLGLGLPAQILQLSSRSEVAATRTLLLAQLVPSFVLCVLGTACLLVIEPFGFMPLPLVLTGCASAFVGTIFNSLSWMEYGQGRFAFSTVLRGVVPGSAMLAVLALFYLGTASAQSASSAYLVAQVLAVIWITARHIPTWRSMIWVPNIVRTSYAKSTGFFTTQAMIMVTNRAPVVAAAAALGSVETAVVSVSLSLAEVQIALVQIRSAMIFRSSSTERAPRFSRSHLAQCLLAIVPMTGLVLVASLIAPAFLPEEYVSMPGQVAILSVGVITMGLVAPAVNILTVRERTRHAIYPLLGSMTIFVVIVLSFGATLGPWGTLSVWSSTTVLGGGIVLFLAGRKPRGVADEDQH